jgi:hypothetical protein
MLHTIRGVALVDRLNKRRERVKAGILPAAAIAFTPWVGEFSPEEFLQIA